MSLAGENFQDSAVASTEKRKRLFALDALRGVDMILLVAVYPLVKAAQKGWHCFSDGFMAQFTHGWESFTMWDMIMPLFIFMCGAAIPLSLAKRLDSGGYWRHVAYRVTLLWFLGGLVQGNWAKLDLLSFSPFSNTLQAIAIGYFAVAATLALRRKMLLVAVPVACVAIYTLLLSMLGDYTETGNAAFKIESAILNAILPAKSMWVVRPSSYTWFATSLMFIAMTFAGYHATCIIQTVKGEWRKVATLCGYGASLLVVGAVALYWIPCIKPIFTFSFTALSTGVCIILYAAFYVVHDIYGIRRGFGFVKFFGQSALAAYFVSHFFRSALDAVAKKVGSGIVSHLSESAQPFMDRLLFVTCLVAFLVIWRRANRTINEYASSRDRAL